MEMMTAEQALEAVKGVTFEQAWAILMAEHKRMAEERAKRDEEWVKREAKWDEERAKREAEREAERAKREEDRAKQEAERKRTEAERAEREAKRAEQEAERKAELDNSLKEMRKNLGGIGNTIGDVTQEMFWPKLLDKFNEFGLPLDSQTKSKKFYRDNVKIAEIDSFLENKSHVMLVEIKTKLEKNDINYHLERIECVREDMDKLNDNRKLIGAVAGATVSEHVMQYAHKNGLYVLTQSGDAVKVSAVPKNFKAREW